MGDSKPGQRAAGKASRVRRIISLTAWSLVATAVVVLAMMWLAGVFEEKLPTASVAATGRPATGLQTAIVRWVTVPRRESAVGTITPVRETDIGSKILARVKEVRVDAGQRVSPGQTLVLLDDTDLVSRCDQASAAVGEAEAAHSQARADFERIERLAEAESAAAHEVTTATNNLRAAEARLERARNALAEAETMLGYATISAPFVGTVVDTHVEVGDMVSPGQSLLTMYDPSKMQLVANVREALAERLKVGEAVDVRVEALAKTCQGVIDQIVPQAEPGSRSFQVKVSGPCPPGIYSGMFGRLLIPLETEDVLLVDARAIQRVGQLELVDVVASGVLNRRAVRTGRAFDGRVEVLSGLRAGEKVALPPTSTGADE